MNTALAILAHAFRMLIFDPSTTLRVLMPPILVVMACAICSAIFLPDALSFMEAAAEGNPPTAGSEVLLLMLLGVIALLGYALMAVLWHRHVLLNGAERPENLNPSLRLFVGYVGRAVLVALVQFVAALPIGLAFGIVGGSLLADGTDGSSVTVLGLLSSMIFIWLALRFSVILPAAAIGQRMKIRDSWAETRPVALPLWGVAALLTGLNMLVFLITDLIVPDQGVFAAAIQGAVFIAEGLVFISVLTTLYGHLVEKRSLGQ